MQCLAIYAVAVLINVSGLPFTGRQSWQRKGPNHEETDLFEHNTGDHKRRGIIFQDRTCEEEKQYSTGERQHWFG